MNIKDREKEIDVINKTSNIIALEVGTSVYMGIVESIEKIDERIKSLIKNPEKWIVLKYPIMRMRTINGTPMVLIPLSIMTFEGRGDERLEHPYIVLPIYDFAVLRPTNSMIEQYKEAVKSIYFGIDIKKEQTIVPTEAIKGKMVNPNEKAN